MNKASDWETVIYYLILYGKNINQLKYLNLNYNFKYEAVVKVC